MLRIGIDVGGTFTDVTALDAETGSFEVHKLASTTQDQSIAVTEGVRTILARTGKTASEISYLGHGTTVATNVVLEENGARTALITTGGVRDILEIGRQTRPELYDLNADKPAALVPREQVYPVAERVDADGKALVSFTEDALDSAARRIAEYAPEAIAVCFLHSYRNPEHESAAVRRLRELFPEAYVCSSADIAPVFREFERFSTTVVNAYVGPRIERYLSRLAGRIDELGVPVEPRVIGSSGGLSTLDAVRKYPVGTLLSGPSAGVVGAAHLARVSGYTELITFDMGGTSTDVCLVSGGAAKPSTQRGINGRPVRTPSLDIHTVGAGGGSIASVDGGGALEVGPASAGSQPGPAAYGRGGQRPTVTDANVLRGRLNPRFILGGALEVDYPAAERAVSTVAEDMGVDNATAARGIGRIAAVNMAGAVRKVSVEAGEDPRGYVLVAFGGAGPLHAVEVAREVGMASVLVPPNPGTLCALGLLATDIRGEFTHAVLAETSARELGAVNEVLSGLRATATEWLDEQAPEGAKRSITGLARLRYARQNFELTVPIEQSIVDSGRIDAEELEALTEAFHRAHAKTYGYAHEQARVQLVELALTATAEVPRPEIPRLPENPTPAEPFEYRAVDFETGESARTPVYRRAELGAGERIQGPAIVEQMDTTTVVTPDARARVDEYGNILIELEGHSWT